MEKGADMCARPLLQVQNLSVAFEMYDTNELYFKAQKQLVFVLQDLNFSISAGEVVAIIGESGAGKTTLIDSILGLNPENAHVTGEILVCDAPRDKHVHSNKRSSDRLHGAMCKTATPRTNDMVFIPQTVSHLDPMRRMGKLPGAGLFEQYGLSPDVKNMYPHQLSGGMAKRVLFCNALALNPRIILADEPTSGLDEQLALEILGDIRNFATDKDGGVLIVTHDISLTLNVADRIAVFKDGTIAEIAIAGNFRDPHLLQHPYSRALVQALPENEFCGN